MNRLSNNTLTGSWATLLLATGKDGEIDYRRLEDEIDVLIASSPDGIYSNGTAGEFYAQTETEFMKISECLAFKCEAADIPFQIGVSHMSPQISLQRLKEVKHLKPGAVQVILPDWFPVTVEESIVFMQKMEETAKGIPLILYNPPHAKKILSPGEWMTIKGKVPSLIGVKVFDGNRNAQWYEDVRANVQGLSVFIPGHNLATGLISGAHGTYSNMACLNPFAAQKWCSLIRSDQEAALELEERIHQFMDTCITPFILKEKYPNHACDRFMAMIGGWCDVGPALRWPYRSIPENCIEDARKKGRSIIPDFFTQYI